MGRGLHKLTALGVERYKRRGLYGDGGGLYLRVAAGATKSWSFRFTLAGRTRDMGLGPFPAVSLAAAREAAQKCRQLVAAGVDPIAARNAEREAARIVAARAITFQACATAFIESHEAGWRNEKHRAQWRSTLATYVYPAMGKLPVAAIDTELVLKALTPLWTEKPETGSRLRQRIERVLDAAKAKGLREGENPARWRGHLDQLLPAKGKVRKVVHHAALPYREVPALMTRLRGDTSISSSALQFLILTATRTGETLGARWDEIELSQRTWVIPGKRMKGGREHRVPLAPRAISILIEMQAIRQNEYVFFGMKLGRPLSNMALLMLMRRTGHRDVTAHGFRSSFRDWAAEQTNFPREVAEAALAHAVPDAVEAAYRRGDFFEKRVRLMEAWSAYCARAPRSSNNVHELRAKGVR